MSATSGGPGDGRVAIVTGGSRGTGLAAAQRLATLGYAVVVNYLHDQRTAESAVDALLADRGAAVAIRADVADELDVERLFDQTIETFGSVDAVVHAVRGQVSGAPATEVSIEEFDHMHRTSLRSTFIVNRMAARYVPDGGAIVNLFSGVHASVGGTYGVYAASSAAIERLIRVLALDLRDRNVTVNGISLDVDTPCTPDSVAETVVYLLSDAGHATTGDVVHLPPGEAR